LIIIIFLVCFKGVILNFITRNI